MDAPCMRILSRKAQRMRTDYRAGSYTNEQQLSVPITEAIYKNHAIATLSVHNPGQECAHHRRSVVTAKYTLPSQLLCYIQRNAKGEHFSFGPH